MPASLTTASPAQMVAAVRAAGAASDTDVAVRPLRKGADFARFSGQKAEVRMRTPDATGRRRFVGVLRGANGGRVEIELDGQIVALELADVERAKLVPEL